MKGIIKLISCIISITFLLTMPARAQSLLRDAETEAFFHKISDPLFKSAGLTPSSVHMYLLGDTSINAFVTGGQNIFIHSGLILAADNVNQLRGVIAHETGHISGGHLSRSGDAFKTAGSVSIVSMVLGAAMVLAGGGDAGMGMIMAGQSMAQRSVLAYTRVQESAADQAGFSLLEANKVTGRGMLEFFDKLRDQEIMLRVRQDPYTRSHPLNSQRIMKLQGVVEQSPYFRHEIDKELNDEFLLLKAKLYGYLKGPVQTLRTYPIRDTSKAARYARTYAYHKALEWDAALAEADLLIASDSTNPYYHEIKGQVLFENGRVKEAAVPFARAVELAPDSPLILTAYAQVLIAQDNKEIMTKAMPYLKKATRLDPENSFAWFNLAKVYSVLGMQTKASLATAERYYSIGQAPLALRHAQSALKELKEGTPAWYRAKDIVIVAEQQVSENRRRR